MICGTVSFDLILAIFGPFNNAEIFCHLHIMTKNILAMHYALMIAAISMVRHWYIFVLRNPVGQHDGFWSFYLNLTFYFLVLVSQMVFQIFPGKNSYMFYVCSGKFPEPTFQKVNLPAHVAIAGSTAVYILVQAKIKYFQWKNPIKAERLNSKPIISVKSTLANFSTLIVGFIILIPTIALTNGLNNVPFPQLTDPVYLLLIDFHFFIMPAVVIGIALLVYFCKHEKLKKSMQDETKSLILSIWEYFKNQKPYDLKV